MRRKFPIRMTWPLVFCMAVPPLAAQQPAPTSTQASAEKLPTTRDRRQAAKLFMQAGKLFMAEKFEEAMAEYQKATKLDPSNRDYRLAVEVARSHAVTALVQSAAKDRLTGNAAGARAALEHAHQLDPGNPQVAQHMDELGSDALLGLNVPLYEGTSAQMRSAATLEPHADRHSFHVHADARQVLRQVFTAYGIQTTIDDGVSPNRILFDMDEASFAQASHALALATHTFYVPLDAHRALIARDTHEAHQQYENEEMENISITGLAANDISDLVNVAKNIFQIPVAVANPTPGTITLRATPALLSSFNKTLRGLLNGQNQVLLQMRIIQLSHTNERTTGAALPQSFSAMNIYAEESSILTANSTLVSEIVSSGLASADDPLAILGILIASGSVSSSLFSNGLLVFGGGITESALTPGSGLTINLGSTYSNSRQLDNIQLRMGDGESSTLRVGERYPIQTSSYSNMATSSSTISGLTTSGTSSALTSLLSSYSSTATIPQVNYEDLGLTLKTTPSIMRNDHIALSIDLKLDSLSGSTLDGNPILNNRAYSGVATVRPGESVILAGELNKSETRSVTGTPGLDDIPGLSQAEDKDTQKSSSSLLILITPHLVRSPQPAGSSPMLHIERTGPSN